LIEGHHHFMQQCITAAKIPATPMFSVLFLR